MTRFARAKGSKASNERREEEATPWHVMRQQLAEQLSNYGAQSETDTSYNLKEILSKGDNSQKEEVWSDFGETKSNLNRHLKSKKEQYNNKNFEVPKNKLKNTNVPQQTLSVGGTESNTDSNKKVNVEDTTSAVKEGGFLVKGKLKKKNLLYLDNKSIPKDTTKAEVGLRGNKFAVDNLDNFKKRKIEEGEEFESKVKLNSKKHKFDSEKEVVSRNLDISKKKKNNRLQGKNVFIETPVEPHDGSVKFSSSTGKATTSLKGARSSVQPENPLTAKNRKTSKKELIEKSTNNVNKLPRPEENSTNLFNSSVTEKKYPDSVKNGSFISAKQKNLDYSTNNNNPYRSSGRYDLHENHPRKNNLSKFPYEKSCQTIMANGREIHIIKYQGFYVKKDDADELKKLRKKLLAQNVPKEKLETIMKLERRKAEKALAREKKKVCYHCRQFGHNFSDCPDIKESDMSKTGICFKCGSLEHSHFECKVLQHQEFRHAVCFVCKEQGHIARQCPLNSQGLYPKGGSCHLCGEVTHLRKDCPKAVEEKTSKSVTVDILKGTVEDISNKSLQQKTSETKKKKVIQFN